MAVFFKDFQELSLLKKMFFLLYWSLSLIQVVYFTFFLETYHYFSFVTFSDPLIIGILCGFGGLAIGTHLIRSFPSSLDTQDEISWVRIKNIVLICMTLSFSPYFAAAVTRTFVEMLAFL
ncbi:MAG: hypothetical protein Q7S54_00810 [bacterium]|nr:hypothetical protein [bacterium]